MESNREEQNIFRDESVAFFNKSLNQWVKERTGAKFYYYGSYFYDINGNLYKSRKKDQQEHNWPEDRLDDVERTIQKNIQEWFKSFSTPISITEVMQQQYLAGQVPILHLYRKKGSNKCDSISRIITEAEKDRCQSSQDYLPSLSLLGENRKNEIIDSFRTHFELIKEFEGESQTLHIYFIPTLLSLQKREIVINVTTFICPQILIISTIDRLQGGLAYCSLELISDTVKYLSKRALDEATKTAKAAIMSRNMSHNLGSHVMAYLKQHLGSVASILQDNVLTQLFSNNDNYENWVRFLKEKDSGFIEPEGANPMETICSNVTLPFFVGLGRFISYLQERQDFIATIATDYIPYYSTVNFKDFIYDELNPDKRYERHRDRKNLCLDNILLGNIARSEGLGRTTSPTQKEKGKLCDIVIKFGAFNGDLCQENTEAFQSLMQLRGFNVSLPGGIVGRQAFFSIVENVIRNAAKHGKWRDLAKLELTFNKYDISDTTIPDKDGYRKQPSLQEVINTFYKPASDINDLFIVTLTDNTKFPSESLTKLHEALYDDYVDESGILKSANKGLKEMRISSAWLRSIRDESLCVNPYQLQDREEEVIVKQIKDNHLLAPLLYARIAVDEFSDNHLQYIICLPKPKKIAIVSDVILNDSTDQDWRLFTRKQFKEVFNKSFDFILCDDSDETDEAASIYEYVRPYSSARTYSFSKLGISREQVVSCLQGVAADRSAIEKILLEKISAYQPGDYIYIDDEKTHNKYKGRISRDSSIKKISVSPGNSVDVTGLVQGEYLQIDRVFISDGKLCGSYLYRTHHDTFDQFNKFMASPNRDDFIFVEGITGDNSTDRLVRNESINQEWFHKHLHAMKTRVAVFDERIFAKVYGLEDASFTRGKYRLVTKDNLEETKAYYVQIASSEEQKEQIKYRKSPDSVNRCVIEKMRAEIFTDQLYAKGTTGTSFIQRGLSVFTLIPAIEDSAKYYLVGAFVDPQTGRMKLNDRYECFCTKVATLSWDNNEKEFHVNLTKEGEKYKKSFHFLTIHQGLLDKLYEAFGIKDTVDLKERLDMKDKITAGLFDHFIAPSMGERIMVNDVINETGENAQRAYLPGVLVHSGRSKPGQMDMPQILPFMQYAALEHAVLDCKYSLVELLDHARYEQ